MSIKTENKEKITTESIYRDFVYIEQRLRRVSRYIKGLTKPAFIAKSEEMEEVQDAVCHCLGTAADALKRSFPLIEKLLPDLYAVPDVKAIDVKGWTGVRIFMEHKYHKLDLNVVWESVETDAVLLFKQITLVLDYFEQHPELKTTVNT